MEKQLGFLNGKKPVPDGPPCFWNHDVTQDQILSYVTPFGLCLKNVTSKMVPSGYLLVNGFV